MSTHRHTHTLTCNDAFQFICENLDSTLDSPACKEIRKHIEQCDNCTAYLDSLKKTVSFYQHYPTPPSSSQSIKKLIAVLTLDSKTDIRIKKSSVSKKS